MEIKLRPVKVQGKDQYSKFMTIPKAWLDNHNIKTGDRVALKIDELGRLVAMPQEDNGATEQTG